MNELGTFERESIVQLMELEEWESVKKLFNIAIADMEHKVLSSHVTAENMTDLALRAAELHGAKTLLRSLDVVYRQLQKKRESNE